MLSTYMAEVEKILFIVLVVKCELHRIKASIPIRRKEEIGLVIVQTKVFCPHFTEKHAVLEIARRWAAESFRTVGSRLRYGRLQLIFVGMSSVGEI